MLLTGRLVRLIQDHSEGLAAGLAAKVRNHPDLPALAKRSTAELQSWCTHQLTYLTLSIAAEGEDVRGRYQTLGRERFAQSIPLHEAVLGFYLLKDMIIEFTHTQGLPMTALDLYVQEELEQRICRFFDAAVYNVVCGYEDAMRQPGHVHA